MQPMPQKAALIAHEISSVGGIQKVTLDVAHALESHGVSSVCFSLREPHSDQLIEGLPNHCLEPRNRRIKDFYRKHPEPFLLFHLRRVAPDLDLLIATHFHLLGLSVGLAAKLGKPVWLMAHGIEIWREWNPREQSWIRDVDRIIAVSRYTASSVGSRLEGEHRDKITVIPNMVDTDLFSPGGPPDTGNTEIIRHVGSPPA